MTTKIRLFILLLTVAVVSSCNKGDDPVIPNEEEVITTLNYTLVPVGGGVTVVLTFKDLDGDGGNAPVITNGTLAANTTYNGSIELLNEQETPAEDITEEIEEEDEEHQFFFTNNIAGLSIAYDPTDVDADGNPIGLKTQLTTGAAGMGEINIVLRHEPNKNASGVSSGNIANAGGETDIEVTFDVDVQ